ncbi:hypothetical protein CR513_10935, partial [Mucuna pruriens]
MARFLSGLNKNIQDIVELHHYTFISMLVSQASKVESQLNESSQDDVSKSDGYSSVETLLEGDLLMVRGLMFTFIEDNSQRQNIFQSRWMVKGSCYSFIIDGGSNVNVATLQLVEKLCLPIIPHLKPYKLQWLNTKGNMLVNKQVLVELTQGKYKDEILCDVVPMQETHILFGRPW